MRDEGKIKRALNVNNERGEIKSTTPLSGHLSFGLFQKFIIHFI